MVQTVHDVGEADAVDVEHRRRIRVRAHHRRVAGDDQDVAQSRGGRAQEVADHTEHIAVPARIVENGFDPDLALDDDRRRQHTHAGLGARTVKHVHRVDPGLLERSATIDHRSGAPSLFRHDLNRRDEVTAGDLSAELRAFG